MKFPIKRLYTLLLALVLLVSSVSCTALPEQKNPTSPLTQTTQDALPETHSSDTDFQTNEGEGESEASDPQTKPESPETPSGGESASTGESGNLSSRDVDLSDIPDYSGSPFVVLCNNKPNFDPAEVTTTAFERYSDLDFLGRCGVALACCGKEIMPAENEKRGSISSIKPSGWVQKQYDHISGKYLFNRCHLIGWQLSAENANRKNLITGTKYFNVEGMLPFENMIADYIKETGHHVMYRITPMYQDDDLVAGGVRLEAYSVEDHGKGICFHVYCYNVQPGVLIDYATGESRPTEDEIANATPSVTTKASTTTPTTTTKAPTTTTQTPTTTTQAPTATEQMVWIPTKGGTKYHSKSTCSNMIDPDYVSLSEAISRGFSDACKRCH